MVGVLLVLVVGANVLDRLRGDLAPGSCTVLSSSGDVDLDPEQAANAATIAAASIERQLPMRAAVIATATAMQESKLHNLDHGDRDSLGLFQQRPSQGWGSAEQVTDPFYSTEKFYDHLVKVGGWQTRPLTEVAQDVQRSGFPEAYAKHEQEATALASAFTGTSPLAVTCRLADPTTSQRVDTVAADVDRNFGVRSQTGTDGRITVGTDTARGAAAIAAWAVAHAEATGIRTVSVAGSTWTRSNTSAAAKWAPDAAASTPTRVVIGLRARAA